MGAYSMAFAGRRQLSMSQQRVAVATATNP
jgi:hypothetical protein